MQLPSLPKLGLSNLRLRPREQRLLLLLLILVGLFVILGVPIGLEWLMHSRRSANEDMTTALNAIQSARPSIREHQARKESIMRRYQTQAPPLAGFLEQAARSEKLEVTDSVDRPEIPIGKKYVERNTVVHLKKAGMYAIAKFLERIEQSNVAATVTRLNLRKRTGEPDSYDVEIGVSAYDRALPGAQDKEKKQL